MLLVHWILRPRKINYLFPLTPLNKIWSVGRENIFFFFTSIILQGNLEKLITIRGLLYCLYWLVTLNWTLKLTIYWILLNLLTNMFVFFKNIKKTLGSGVKQIGSVGLAKTSNFISRHYYTAEATYIISICSKNTAHVICLLF